jgi:uncharacterized cupredoxin-like copper-binding protein
VKLRVSRDGIPRLGVLAAAAALVLAACSAAATPTATFGPGNTATPTPEPSATHSATPVPTESPTAVPTVAPTPFVSGTTQAPRAVEIDMLDTFAFEPSAITVQAGETVRFVVHNTGVHPHDFTVGDEMDQMHHAEEMAQGMHGGHGANANAITVEAGQTGELLFTFPAAPAEWLIGCHIPGHYAAGMKGTLSVVASMP